MTSLGERLKSQNEERERRAAEEAARQKALAEEAEREMRTKFVNFFREVRTGIVTDIEANNKLRHRRIKHHEPYMFGDKLPSNPEHKYHEVWLEFVAWLSDNGLAVDLVYGHDGAGLDSWYEIKISPAVF